MPRRGNPWSCCCSGALAFALAALAPGRGVYEAAAQVVGAAAPAGSASAASAAGAAAAPARLSPDASLAVSLRAPSLSLPAFAASVPTLPAAAAASAAALSAPSATLPAPASAALPAAAGAAAALSPAFAAQAPVVTPSTPASPAQAARVELARTADALRSVPAPGASALLERLFTGAASAAADGAPPAPAAADSSAPAPLARASAPVAAPPGPPAPPTPPGDDWIDRKAVAGMFVQRSFSIAGFLLTSLAYPFLAVHAVGAAGFGALMALGPMAAIAAGPLNGLIVDRLSPRNGMALFAALRGALACALPAFMLFGVMGFWPLLAASLANGWQLSLLTTSENAYFRRLAGKNQISKILAGTSVNYYLIQVSLTLIVGLGALVDGWNPIVPFAISAAIHALVVIPVIWLTQPNLAPVARAASDASARLRAAKGALARWARAYWKEAALFVLAVAAYGALGSPLPLSGALLYGVSRSRTFREVWAQPRLRSAMLFWALVAGAFSSFQLLAVPLIAQSLAGAAGKSHLLAQLLGAISFGQLIANASRAGLPSVRLPFTRRRLEGRRLVEAAALALAALWSGLRLFPGSWAAAGGAVLLGGALLWVASRLDARAWVRLAGVGLIAAAAAPLFFWGSIPVLFAGLFALGFFVGPAVVALIACFSRAASAQAAGQAFGASTSLVQGAVSLGYGALTLVVGLFAPSFPGALWPIAAALGLLALALLAAPRRLPGLAEDGLSRRPGASRPR